MRPVSSASTTSSICCAIRSGGARCGTPSSSRSSRSPSRPCSASLIALLLNSELRARGLLRAAILVPWAIPTIVSAQLWRWMYNDLYGVVNAVLLVARRHRRAAGLDRRSRSRAWRRHRGRRVEDDAVHDAAHPGGVADAAAGYLRGRPRRRRRPLRVFLRITLPLIWPALMVAVIFRILDALRVFDLIYVLTANSRETMSMSIYARQYLIEFQDVGIGSAAATLLFGVIALVVAVMATVGRVRLGGGGGDDDAHAQAPMIGLGPPRRWWRSSSLYSLFPLLLGDRLLAQDRLGAVRRRLAAAPSELRQLHRGVPRAAVRAQHPQFVSGGDVDRRGLAWRSALTAAYALGRVAFRGRVVPACRRARRLDVPAGRRAVGPVRADPRARPLQQSAGADVLLPDLHAALHDLGADDLHARAAARARGGRHRRRRHALDHRSRASSCR